MTKRKPRKAKHQPSGLKITGRITIDGIRIQNVKDQPLHQVIKQLIELEKKYT